MENTFENSLYEKNWADFHNENIPQDPIHCNYCGDFFQINKLLIHIIYFHNKKKGTITTIYWITLARYGRIPRILSYYRLMNSLQLTLL